MGCNAGLRSLVLVMDSLCFRFIRNAEPQTDIKQLTKAEEISDTSKNISCFGRAVVAYRLYSVGSDTVQKTKYG